MSIVVGTAYSDIDTNDVVMVVNIRQFFSSYHPQTQTKTPASPPVVIVARDFDHYGPLPWATESYFVDDFVDRFVPLELDQLPDGFIEYDWFDAETYTIY